MLEGVANAMSMTEKDAAILLLDIASAFPSLARDALFEVLESLQPPEWWLRMAKDLCQDNIHTIAWKGVRGDKIVFRGGEAGLPPFLLSSSSTSLTYFSSP